MTAFVACRGSRRWVPVLGLLAAVFLVAVVRPGAALAAEPVEGTLRDKIKIHLDQATTLKLPERTGTVVIGNPLIADAAVQGTTIVVTAKSYGETNLVLLDRAGGVVAEYPVEVAGPIGNVVVMYRGVERETYSCTPKCDKRLTIGDSVPFFTQNLVTLGQFNAQAQAQPRQ